MKKLGAEVWTVSIDPPEKLRELRDKMGLEITMLLDPESETIRRYGLLNQQQGHIPHPAALVIDQRGVVRYVRVDEEYKQRPSSAELLGALRELRRKR